MEDIIDRFEFNEMCDISVITIDLFLYSREFIFLGFGDDLRSSIRRFSLQFLHNCIGLHATMKMSIMTGLNSGHVFIVEC